MKGWPSPLKAEMQLLPSGDDAALDVIRKRNRLIAIHDLDPAHEGHTINELKMMERYALPADYGVTIDAEAVKTIAATKELPGG